MAVGPDTLPFSLLAEVVDGTGERVYGAVDAVMLLMNEPHSRPDFLLTRNTQYATHVCAA